MTEESVVALMGLDKRHDVIRADPIPRNLQLSVSQVTSRREEIVYYLKYRTNFSEGAAIV